MNVGTRNEERSRAVSFREIHKSDFLCSVLLETDFQKLWIWYYHKVNVKKPLKQNNILSTFDKQIQIHIVQYNFTGTI
jgi:hypothetical protein